MTACLVGPPEDELWLRIRLVFGPWPDSSMPLAEAIFLSSRLRWQELWRGSVVVVIIAHNIRRGGHLCRKVLVLGVALLYIKDIFLKCLGMTGAKDAHTFVQAKPGTKGPKSWSLALS